MPLTIPLARYFSMPSRGVGRHRLEMKRLELAPMLLVDHPIALSGDPLSRRNAGRRADNGDQITMTFGLYPEYAKSTLFRKESDAFNQPVQLIACRRRRWS